MEIKNRWTDVVLFTTEKDNLCEADLRGADLRGAKYGGEELVQYITIGPIGSRKDILQVFILSKSGILIKTGCFNGNCTEFRTAVRRSHAGTIHETQYLKALVYIESLIPQEEIPSV